MESKRFLSFTVYRYVLAEMFFTFLICFCFFFFVFFVNQILLLAREVLERHVPFGQVALLILFSLPTVIAMSAPFASLVATLMTIGRLTSDNEILVMLTSGFSYKIVFFPALTMGIIISILSFFTNDVLLPAGMIQYNKLWRRILVSVPALELQANSVKRFRDTFVITGGVSGNVINDLLILDKTEEGERRMIMASSAELRDSGKEGLNLNLDNAFVLSSKEMTRENYDYATADQLQYWVSNEDIMQMDFNITPREMSSRDVLSTISARRLEIAENENNRKIRLANQAFALENILREGPGSQDWNRRASYASTLQREINSLISIRDDRNLLIHVVEIHRKFSVPIGAFCFVFLAVSLGLMAKGNGQTVGFIYGVIIAVLYWCLLYIGQLLALRSQSPPLISMWFPNIMSLLTGMVLMILRAKK
ncbi:MAG: LptF/LptG family permease [Treponema sp.]|nr:LptF/LptG family permease [Treponema sp.]